HRPGAEDGAAHRADAAAHRRGSGCDQRAGECEGHHQRAARLYRPGRRHCLPGGVPAGCSGESVLSRQVADLPRAWPATGCRAEFRREVTDFRVDEVLGFTLDGEGEHVFLYLEKIDLNTEEVARRIARLADVRQMDVGFSGMKDRRAVAR